MCVSLTQALLSKSVSDFRGCEDEGPWTLPVKAVDAGLCRVINQVPCYSRSVQSQRE